MKFDIKNQEWEYYRHILNSPNMIVLEYGVYGKIVQLTAKQYITEVARILRSTYESHMKILTEQPADRKNIEYLKTLDFPISIPVLNYSCNAQEGRHRAIAFSELHGEDATFPCLVVNWIDENKRGLSFWQWMSRRKKEQNQYRKVSDTL